MSDAASRIDALMEQASEKLAVMQYLECERLCERALAMARQAKDFDRMARIVLPLQESRRQRRQAAEDAGVTVISEKLSPAEVLKRYPRGCLMLAAPPYDAGDLRMLRQLIRPRGSFVEVLLMDQRRLEAAFLAALEEQGDALLAGIDPAVTGEARLDAMLEVVEQVGDHEIAHQRLAAAARAMRRQG